MEYWKVGNSVESHSYPHKVPGGKRITKENYDEFMASLSPIEPEPVRDPLAEIDDLKVRVGKLEKR